MGMPGGVGESVEAVVDVSTADAIFCPRCQLSVAKPAQQSSAAGNDSSGGGGGRTDVEWGGNGAKARRA